jgi:hypothetical protein
VRQRGTQPNTSPPPPHTHTCSSWYGLYTSQPARRGGATSGDGRLGRSVNAKLWWGSAGNAIMLTACGPAHDGRALSRTTNNIVR